MAAFDPTASQPGAVNNAGDNKALYLKVFSGEILTAFNKSTQFKDRHHVQTIQSGKSAQFPVIGNLSDASNYLQPGAAVSQDSMNHAERLITIDGLLYKSLMISEIDEAYNHIDVRQEYTSKIGESLAQTFDKNVARTGLQAARAANVVTGQPGGSTVNNVNSGTDGDALFASLFTARQTLDEKDIDEQAWSYLKPLQYYLLAQVEKLVDRDLAGENGNFQTGMVKGIAGLEVVKTNNLPTSNVTGTIGGKYDIDASSTTGLVMTRSAVGTVKLKELQTRMPFIEERLSTLLVSYIMMGHGILQPQCAVEISSAVA